MSSLNKIMQQALGSTALKRIKFKRDPGNFESADSYEGYLLEEDEVSGTATIFIPGEMDSLLNVDMSSIEEYKPPVESNLCKLIASATRCLVNHGYVDCELEIKKISMLQTLEQLEAYLAQHDLTDLQKLNMYRDSFKPDEI
jgi:hypothetical protein